MTLILGQTIHFTSIIAWKSYENKLDGGVGGISSILFPFFSFILVVSMAYPVAKLIVIKSSRYKPSKNFNIIDQFQIDKHTRIIIVNIAGQVYILGRTEHGIEVIDALNDTRTREIMEQNNNNNKNFQTYLKDELDGQNSNLLRGLLKQINTKLPTISSKSKQNCQILRPGQKNSKDDKNELD